MPKSPKTDVPADLFAAAWAANAQATATLLAAGADVHAVDAHGFTALQRAASSADHAPMEDTLATLRLLIDAGSPLEHEANGGRTALYLAAEFSPDGPEAVQLLVDAGARPDVRDAHGNHVVENAWSAQVKALLCALTGHAPPEAPVRKPDRKMSAAAWKLARAKIDAAFAALEATGIVTGHAQGDTQDDGHDDTHERFVERGGTAAGLRGFCFYSGDDMKRAKRTSDLSIGFWGPPDSAAMERIGQAIVDAFASLGLPAEWDGTEGMRPIIDLRSLSV
ncbi:ankyrin repeat domain-containing protein [Stenotrophomonas sp. ESTM1D_MKCIP4_1]|uniref:ankyrin repeat domain-containing protein n=1 Tax=Stenotrophomonas sp. ESTM1D_MKCIP4_1 TaxID=2072414 RepID=UPI000D54172A|nr:ankyrin repeat domain-containing protein [Stenotrophomonas sp. ESTM1D_MKCIP4_1]AWH54662.1 ankyrin repeat domain-containing protein [Stenotrophomonas sp. ESTM1D_MKCIP4_1]